MTFNVAVLPGDGIGPEITTWAVKSLRAACDVMGIALQSEEYHFGGAAIDATGVPLPQETLDACLASDAVFLGAIGGPKWDSAAERPEKGLLAIRKALGVYANLRPLAPLACLSEFSPLKPEILGETDLLIVRELTGGAYFGEKSEGDDVAHDLMVYSAPEVERIAHVAFKAAQGRRKVLTSVDKANVLASSRLWRRTVEKVHQDYPDVELRHEYVDAMAMHLIQKPSAFDVVVTENLFGDILSDESSVISGSIGLLGSASLGDGTRGLYEPIHGSAPDIAGKGLANPIGSILSVAMLLRHSAGAEEAARLIETAVTAVTEAGERTPDIGGTATTADVGQAVVDYINAADATLFTS